MSATDLPEPALPRFERGGRGLEFDRVTFFTDAIFAIAMTLLVVDTGIPAVAHGDRISALADAIVDNLGGLVAFFIGFAILGFYWLAHHRFMSRLGAVDRRFAALNLLYLSFIAFLPFPTGLLGEYSDNPLSVAVFALTAGAVSAMEGVLFWYAHRAHLETETLPEDVFRYGLATSLLPVGIFVLSIPVAFLAPWAGVATWFLSAPAQALGSRWAPPDAARWYH